MTISIGTAIVSYIEPHAGQARQFNRWYERDHFYAATTAGPGAFSGARWVATGACKAVRPARATWFGDPARGSYLTTVWLLEDAQAEWEAWVAQQMSTLRDAAQELAEKIAKNSPAAMAATKRALWGALEMGLTDACKAGARELVGMWGHPDQEEGPRAFAEKREPQWQPLETPRFEAGSAP